MKKPKFNLFDVVYICHPDTEIGIVVGIKYLQGLEEIDTDPFSYTVKIGMHYDKNFSSSALFSPKEINFEAFLNIEFHRKRKFLEEKKEMIDKYGIEFFKEEDD